ncbi:E3 ubiquitin-protein ligase MARCHF6 isoform X2 [Bemisia tabaci]|uniref:E3 ubiquitin-protein ligase MARCHF6 isoform X2 n=1 Tax=Bemisia tabaci TaxID=7038 RepID=UPI0008F986E1|nr:PREDICTED: E3 ubiquitin-protein ligase MARCH6 isoform X2 [Bemisia tabaci]
MEDGHICRVCRCEGAADRPLFHPCICTGSIKWIHQECLLQWMRYSRKEYCELCGYRFSFTPIYSPDMPRRLPIKDVIGGLLGSVVTAVKYWFHYTIVALAWLGVVPLTACRIYRSLFTGSVDSVLMLPLDVLSIDNIPADIFHGCFVVTCTLLAFLGLIYLREQILHGGGPDWLEQDEPNQQQDARVVQLRRDEGQPAAPENNNVQDAVQNQNEAVAEPENAVEGIAGVGGGAVANDEANFNPIEWDRAGEEITWERLLGLDGSLVFLEHVFWVVSLNTLFILVFAFCPYHMGHFAVVGLGLREHVTASHFEGLVTTLCGYCVIGLCLVILRTLAAIFKFTRSKKVLGMCYVVVKVSLLSVVEVGVLPLVCGWWLDICSLAMFDATLRDRETSFRAAPGTSMFIHWFIGMVYVYYFATFVLLLREVLRPGVLWFLRNLNDPDFSPIQEMIHLPIIKHLRRLLVSVVIFGTAVLLMLYVPVKIIKFLLPGFLPYTVTQHSEAQVNELSLEFLLLQVIMPALMEHSHTRTWLKSTIRIWCRAVAWLLDIKSFLLGDEAEPRAGLEDQNEVALAGDLGALHHAIWQLHGILGLGAQPYKRPKFFAARIVCLLVLVAISFVVAAVLVLTIPVWLGRQVMGFWPVGPPGDAATSLNVPVHELYTAACGTYLLWLIGRFVSLVCSWLPQGRAAIMQRLWSWCIVGAKCAVAFMILIGVIPLLFGLLLELIVLVPLRVPLNQTPILWVWQDWVLGVLYTKIACAITMMGPDWALRRAIERTFRDGIMRMNLGLVLRELAAPVIGCLSLALAVPYVIAHSLAPLVVSSLHFRNIIVRRIYPFLLIVSLIFGLINFQIRQFSKLYEHIKNDKYLVGRRLVNYHHKSSLSE